MKKAKLRHCKDGNQEYDMLWLWCPGCNEHHAVKVNIPGSWSWNDSEACPTISPSIRVSRQGKTLCHSFVTDGKIQFLSDSAHALAGQTVELPDMDEEGL